MSEQTKLIITGMSCDHCVSHVSKALKDVDGVINARVDLTSGEAEVEYDPVLASMEQMKKSVEDAGYGIVV
jgi:copper chaperone CopZ